MVKAKKKTSGEPAKRARRPAKQSSRRKGTQAAAKRATRASSGAKKKTTASPAARPTKKTVARPKKPRRAGRARRNAGLSPSDVNHFRGLLLARRATLLGDVASMTNEALGKNRQDASGDLSNMPIHMADIGSDNYEQEFTLGLLESEQALLGEIDAALARMERGTYGICLGTGKRINKARLEANPWAKYCIEYAREVEKGLAPDIEVETPGAAKT